MKTQTQISEAPAIFQQAEDARVQIMQKAQKDYEAAYQTAHEIGMNMRTIAKHIDTIVAAMAKVGLQPREIRPSGKTNQAYRYNRSTGQSVPFQAVHVYIRGEKKGGKFRFLQDTDQVGFDSQGRARNDKQINAKESALVKQLEEHMNIAGAVAKVNKYSLTTKRNEQAPRVMLDFYIPVTA